jgi:alpha-mannosidase
MCKQFHISDCFFFTYYPGLCRLSSNRSLLLFGHGDGGGGPAVSHLEKLNRMVAAPGLPRIHMEATPEEFFHQVIVIWIEQD